MAVLRGFLFVAFFGGLVWFAISQGGQQEAGRSATLAAEKDVDRPQQVPVVERERVQVPPSAPTPDPDPMDEAPEDEVATDIYDDAPAEEAPLDNERPEWLTMEEAPVALDEYVEQAAALEPRALELQRSASSEQAENGGPGELAPLRSPSIELGNLVLHAVVSGDPQQLNNFLGNGGEVSEGERLLVSTFWSAVTGNVEQAQDWLAGMEVGDGVTRAQLDLVGAAIDGGRARPMEASYGGRDPLALAMGMVLLHLQAQADIRDGRRSREAAEALSDLLQLELGAPWSADRARLSTWGELLNNQQSRHRLSPLGDWPSIDYEVVGGDHLIGIRKKILAQRPGALLCTGLIEAVNQLGEYLQPGKILRIPTTLPNVVVDLDSRILLYRHGDEVVRTWIVGIGREGHETPVGTYIVGGKQPEPSWMPVGAPARPFGHPENPLGTRWISWDRDGMPTSYGFHGTSDPSGVGGTVSKGCIRMHNEHVEELYELLPTGATIVVQR